MISSYHENEIRYQSEWRARVAARCLAAISADIPTTTLRPAGASRAFGGHADYLCTTRMQVLADGNHDSSRGDSAGMFGSELFWPK